MLSKYNIIPHVLVFCTHTYGEPCFSYYLYMLSQHKCFYVWWEKNGKESRWTQGSIHKYTRKSVMSKVNRSKIKHFVLQRHVCPLFYQYFNIHAESKIFWFDIFLWYICRFCWCQKEILPFLFRELRLAEKLPHLCIIVLYSNLKNFQG